MLLAGRTCENLGGEKIGRSQARVAGRVIRTKSITFVRATRVLGLVSASNGRGSPTNPVFTLVNKGGVEANHGADELISWALQGPG